MASRQVLGDRPGPAGKLTTRPEIEQAAALTALGLPGWEFVTTRDPVDRLLLIAVAERVAEYRSNERKALAIEIVNAIAKAMK